MKHLQVTVNDRMALIGLDRGKSNAINTEMLHELSDLIKNIEKDDAISGIILHGKDRFFSSGLDLIELYDYNEVQMREFWTLFLEFVNTFAQFKKPSVAAISGHSPAGGCVLALCCDYRVMVEGDYIIGLNEVPVGIIVPEGIFQLYSFWIGQAKAYRYLLEGKLLSPQQALEAGLVDELVSAEKLRGRAEKQLISMMQFDAETWQQSKINMRRGLNQQMSATPPDMLEKVLKQWWAPSTRSILKTIISNLTAK